MRKGSSALRSKFLLLFTSSSLSGKSGTKLAFVQYIWCTTVQSQKDTDLDYVCLIQSAVCEKDQNTVAGE